MVFWPTRSRAADTSARDMRLLRLRRRGLTLQQIGEAFHLSRPYVAERVKTAERVALLRAAQHGADTSEFHWVTRRKGPGVMRMA